MSASAARSAVRDRPGALRRALERAAIDLYALAGTRRYRRFVIVGIARTGSTLLLSLLNSHPQVLCFGELFRAPDAIGWDVRPYRLRQDGRLLALYRRDPVRFLERAVYRRWPRRLRAVGFKLFYYHSREQPFTAVWEHLRQRTDVAIIHLKRRNLLAQYLSVQIAHRTDVWALTEPQPGREPSIRLDPDACARHFAWVRSLEREADVLFQGHRVLDVAYEDLATRQAGTMMQIEEFLGLDPLPVHTRMVRQRTIPAADAIENFAELREAFAATDWAGFFRDPGA